MTEAKLIQNENHQFERAHMLLKNQLLGNTYFLVFPRFLKGKKPHLGMHILFMDLLIGHAMWHAGS